MNLNQEKLQEFMEIFEKEIFPTIKGEDGQGIQRLKEHVQKRRKEVEANKIKRKQHKNDQRKKQRT